MRFNVFNGGPWAEDEPKFELIGHVFVDDPAKDEEETRSIALWLAVSIYGGHPAVAPA